MAGPGAEDLRDIQGIVLSGFGDCHCASYMLLRVTEGAAARRWLGSIINQITTSERAEKVSAMNVALTRHGLEQLGLDAETVATFSRPFLEGMATPHRSRILGDEEDNGPEHWQWGRDEGAEAVDILLLMYGENEAILDAALAQKRAEFAQNGVAEVLTLSAGRQEDSHEHFGFADGMGQPAIEDTFQVQKTTARNILKAGEFLLGYINDYDKPADSPMVRAGRDPNSHLAPPRFVADPGAADARSEFRDLGLNGTYLVFRQLAQDVELFRRCMDEATRGLDGNLNQSAADHLAAKIVGRWQNGAPLVLSPDLDDPKLKDADEFGFRDTDAHGFKCPIGSHIRRSNPRDSLGPDGAKALKSANRHRILRRGRSYGHRPANPRVRDNIDRGLHFLCLNTDIERQFEFVQQTWINNPVFGGLNGEVDPLVGNVSRTETSVSNPAPQTSDNGGSGGNGGSDYKRDAIFTMQADPLRTRVHKLERFVTLKGGAYFFLPSIRALRYLASL